MKLRLSKNNLHLKMIGLSLKIRRTLNEDSREKLAKNIKPYYPVKISKESLMKLWKWPIFSFFSSLKIALVSVNLNLLVISTRKFRGKMNSPNSSMIPIPYF